MRYVVGSLIGRARSNLRQDMSSPLCPSTTYTRTFFKLSASSFHVIYYDLNMKYKNVNSCADNNNLQDCQYIKYWSLEFYRDY